MNRHFLLNRHFWIIPILLWTVLVGLSYQSESTSIDRHTEEMALNRARFVFRMIETFRLWNATHGGVYAVIDSKTPPNPYLKVPERDIVSTKGMRLTMINPAYMTRQLTGLIARDNGMRVHITSLKPINPHNVADDWERRALTDFERKDQQEYFRFIGRGKAVVARYMAPLYVKRPCLKCHEKQGYEMGDVRGGISVSFPARGMVALMDVQREKMLGIHIAVWGLLVWLTLLTLSRGRRHVLALSTARDRQELLVERRTAELRREMVERQQAEARLNLVIESSGEGVVGLDLKGFCTLCNQTALKLLGYSSEEILRGRSFHEVVNHQRADGSPIDVDECRVSAAYRGGVPGYADDELFQRADGSLLEVEYRAHPILQDGVLLGAVVTFTDVSKRKGYERELRKLSRALELSPASAVITDAEGTIEFVNQSFMEATGYSREELLGQNPRVLKSGQTPPEVYREFWATLTSGQVWRGEFLNRKKSGELFWERVAVSPILDDDGTITHFVGVKEDITDEKERHEAVWRQANYDALTGLPNRSLFRDRMHQAVMQARRTGTKTALLFVDLDGFKAVNDTLGHQAGDELLREVARRLEAAVRESDTVARLAGDEFLAMVSTTHGRRDAELVASKILETVSEPIELNGSEVSISASVGVALYPDHAEECEQLLQLADAAMYAAKQSGKNAYRFAAHDSGGT